VNVLITGCAGFIGSHFVDEVLNKNNNVVGIDSLTYAGKLANMSSFQDRISFHEIDICETDRILNIVIDSDIEWIVNFAAETHVDNSIESCDEFIRTNILGVKSLLDVCRKSDCNLMQISTDEVYGTISSGSFSEEDRLNPRNPYSASKASAEHLVNAYHVTYDVDFKIVRMSNNFGPRQDSEKFLPTIIRKLNKGEKIPVYGDGSNIRDWLYVKDACNIVYKILTDCEMNSAYNVTHRNEMTNLELVRNVTDLMSAIFEESVEFVIDRPGHDFRYSIENKKILELEINSPSDFKECLSRTVEFYEEA